jgi:hypothetical protein
VKQSTLEKLQKKFWLRPFPSLKQLKVLMSPDRFKVLRCGRRAGKTVVILQKMIYTALATPKSPCLYIGLTRDSAKAIAWDTLKTMLYEHKIPATMFESSLTIRFANDSSIRLIGADLPAAQDRLRGQMFALVCVDECGFSQNADRLVSILLPSLSDMEGSLWMASSPGLPQGLFYEADQDPKTADVWERHYWTMFDNPFYIDRAQREMDLICKLKYGGLSDHPNFRQEWYGDWVHNNDDFLFRYQPQNQVTLTDADRESLVNTTISIDFGYNDACGITVGKYGPYARRFVYVEEWKKNEVFADEIALVLRKLMHKYNTSDIVGDMGGLGKVMGEELRRRYGIPIRPTLKSEKAAWIALFNSDLMAGYIQVTDECPGLSGELQKVLKDPLTGIERRDQVCDLADSALYGWRSSNVYQTVKEPDILSLEEQMYEQHCRKVQDQIQEENDPWVPSVVANARQDDWMF